MNRLGRTRPNRVRPSSVALQSRAGFRLNDLFDVQLYIERGSVAQLSLLRMRLYP